MADDLRKSPAASSTNGLSADLKAQKPAENMLSTLNADSTETQRENYVNSLTYASSEVNINSFVNYLIKTLDSMFILEN